MISLADLAWLMDTNLADRLAAQSLLDDMATSAQEKLLDQCVRHAQDSPPPKAASPPVDTAEAPSFDANDGAIQLLALHEASHAVVAESLGVPVSGIELCPSADGMVGHTWITFDGVSPFHQAVVLLAGPVGEGRARAGSAGRPLAFLRAGAVEVAEARDLVGDGLGPALKHTRDLVCGSWLRIESLARRLLRDGSGGRCGE